MGLLGQLANYQTQLNGPEELAYQLWKATLPPNLQNESDYDLRGAYKANAQSAKNGHLPDTFKKPNHMTFSTESQYSTPQQQGGTWADAGDNRWAFWASPQNVSQHSIPEMSAYFQQYEPDSTVIFPSNYRMPRGNPGGRR